MSMRSKLVLVLALAAIGSVALERGDGARAQPVTLQDLAPAVFADGTIVTVEYEGALVGVWEGKVRKGRGARNEPGNTWRLHRASADGRYYLENLAEDAGPRWLQIVNTTTPAFHGPKLTHVRGGEIEISKRRAGGVGFALTAGGTGLYFGGADLVGAFPHSPVRVGWTIVPYVEPTPAQLKGDGTYKSATVSNMSSPACPSPSLANVGMTGCYQCPKDWVAMVPDVTQCLGAPTTKKKTGTKSSMGVKGAWPDLKTMSYYKCKSGYSHNPALSADTKGVCFKTSKPTQAATKIAVKPGLGCAAGMSLDALSGKCFKCPSDAPVRNWLAPVGDAKACVQRTCGAEGTRPCMVTERFPSCDEGLAEDFLANKCVASKVNMCTVIVNGANGIKSAAFDAWVAPHATTAKRALADLDTATKAALRVSASNGAQTMAKYVAEARRLAKVAEAAQREFDDVFKASNLCGDPKALLERLKKSKFAPQLAQGVPSKALGPATPTSSAKAKAGDTAPAEHFYMTMGFSSSAAPVLGVQLGLDIVTDFQDDLMVTVTLGPQLQSDVGLGVVDSFMFYPLASGADFDGDISDFASWGWGLAFGGGEGVVGGIATAWPYDMGVSKASLYQPRISAAGVNFGVGVSLLPASGAISSTYSGVLVSTDD